MESDKNSYFGEIFHILLFNNTRLSKGAAKIPHRIIIGYVKTLNLMCCKTELSHTSAKTN